MSKNRIGTRMSFMNAPPIGIKVRWRISHSNKLVSKYHRKLVCRTVLIQRYEVEIGNFIFNFDYCAKGFKLFWFLFFYVLSSIFHSIWLEFMCLRRQKNSLWRMHCPCGTFRSVFPLWSEYNKLLATLIEEIRSKNGSLKQQ